MTIQDFAKWNKRAAAVYAVGVWGMIASYAYFKYTGHYPDVPARKDNETQEQEDPNKVVHETAHSKTVLVYKKDFIPYSTRIYNFITSISSEPGSGGGEK